MWKLIYLNFIISKVILLFVYSFIRGKDILALKLKFKIENWIIFVPRVKRTYKIKKELLGEFEPVRLITKDFVRLYAWYIKPKRSKPTVLFCPGQSENIGKWQSIAISLKNSGYGVLMLSYRGHYKSTGNPTEEGIYTDADTAIAFLNKKRCKSENIIIWGRSLGSTVACEMAIRHNLKAVILESPIADIKTAATTIADYYLKSINMVLFRPYFEILFRNLNFIQKFANNKKISHIKCPVYIVHSKQDAKIPYHIAEHLHKLNPNSILNLCEHGAHEKNDWCLDSIMEFINSVSSKKAPAK